MRLEQSDAELFYQLWIPLLDFVNRRYRVRPDTKSIDQRQGVDVQVAKAVADYLWSHTEVIEEYLASAELPEEHAQIIASWKRCRPGRYILERHLKKGSVFISAEDGTVYLVKGLFSTWEEMLGKGPVLLDAVLLPFRDNIISDGLVMPYRIYFGRGAAEGFKVSVKSDGVEGQKTGCHYGSLLSLINFCLGFPQELIHRISNRITELFIRHP